MFLQGWKLFNSGNIRTYTKRYANYVWTHGDPENGKGAGPGSKNDFGAPMGTGLSGGLQGQSSVCVIEALGGQAITVASPKNTRRLAAFTQVFTWFPDATNIMKRNDIVIVANYSILVTC